MAKYNILAAMYALDSFTVAQLVAETGEKPNTVHTIIGRNADFLDVKSRMQSGRRGGQEKMWQVKPNRAAELLNKIESEVGGARALLSVSHQPSEPSLESSLLDEVLVAEDQMAVQAGNQRRRQATISSALQSLNILSEAAQALQSGASRDRLTSKIGAVRSVAELAEFENSLQAGAMFHPEKLGTLANLLGGLAPSSLEGLCKRLIQVVVTMANNANGVARSMAVPSSLGSIGWLADRAAALAVRRENIGYPIQTDAARFNSRAA